MRPEPAARALNAVLRDLLDTRDGATYVAGRVWGVHTRHDLGGAHPLVGRSVPASMRDGRAILLDFTNDAALAACAERYCGRIAYVKGDVRHQPGAGALLVRPDGVLAWACGAAPDRAGLEQAAARWFGAPSR
jgi:hypothetical protein